MSVLLVGTKTEGTSTNKSIGPEKTQAFRFEALKTGTVEVLEFKPAVAVQAAEEICLSIAKETSSEKAPTAGWTDKTKKEKPSEAGTGYAITEYSFPVTAGSFYWIALTPIGGAIKVKFHKELEGGSAPSTTLEAPAKVKKASEVTAWQLVVSEGPWWINGQGTEGGAETPMLVMVV